MVAIIWFRIFFFQFAIRNINIKIFVIINWPVDFYKRKTWSLTLMEERRLSEFENRVFRRIFGPKRDEVTGE